MEDTGTMILGCVALLLTGALIVGLILSAVRLRRPDSNRKCHLSFIFFVSGWLLYAAIAGFAMRSEHRFIGICAGLVIFAGLAVTGVIQAILGLSEVRRGGGVQKGRGTAVATLVLSSLCLAAGGVSTAAGVFQGLKQSRLQSAAGPPGPKAVFEEFRFSIQPPRPWIRIDSSKINPVAAAAFLRSRPQIYFMIIAEKLNPESELDLPTLVAVVKSNLAGAAKEHAWLEEGKETLNGMDGIRIVADAKVDNLGLTYLYWIHLSSEYAYQLIAWCARGDAASLRSEARKAFESFDLLQPK